MDLVVVGYFEGHRAGKQCCDYGLVLVLLYLGSKSDAGISHSIGNDQFYKQIRMKVGNCEHPELIAHYQHFSWFAEIIESFVPTPEYYEWLGQFSPRKYFQPVHLHDRSVIYQHAFL